MSAVTQQSFDVGVLLLERGELTALQLEQIKRREARLDIPQHRAIIDLNCASEEAVYRALAELQELEYVDVSRLTPDGETLASVPLKLVFQHRIMPVSRDNGEVAVAFCEPPDAMELGNLRLSTGSPVRPLLSTPSAIHQSIKRHYGLGAETIQRLRDEQGLGDTGGEIVFDLRGETEEMDSTIADFVDQLLLEALRLQATDVHLEPYAKDIRLRYRIDGLMQTVPLHQGLRQVYGAVVSRLKIMAGIDIAEKRLPHDGRIAMKTGDEEYDLRISIVPTKHGEAVCLRILGRQSLFLELGQLGMEPEQEERFANLTRLPQGLTLLTGPTGSGKTTTLYAALAAMHDEGRKIITIEDPVEYQLEGITQIQVRKEINLSFADGLRSVLRHDPDVVLIGEIRDVETAEIAVRAAQTGHLVLSTLHSNDSISAVPRLLEMGVDPFLLGSSLVCAIAQRLARRNCRHCMEPDDIADSLRDEMAKSLKIPREEVRAFRGKGCVECQYRGCRGRVAIYEFFTPSDSLAEAIEPGVKTVALRTAAHRCGWRSLREEGWRKVQSGAIPAGEQQRLTHRLGPQPIH